LRPSQIPQLLVGVQDEAAASFRKVLAFDLRPQMLVRGSPTIPRVAASRPERVLLMVRYRYSPGFFAEKKPVNTAV
jgi:hypothetical protein